MEFRNIEVADASTDIAGALTKTEFIPIGKFQKLEIKKVITTDLITRQSSELIRLDLTVHGEYSTSNKVAVLTKNEVRGLIRSIESFELNVFPTSPSNYTEVAFVTGDFKAGCYYGDKKWNLFLKMDSRDDDSYLFIATDNIDHLKGLLNNTLN